LIRAGKLPQVSWEKIVDHIDHAVRLAGADHVGLGSDFDGAFMPAGMEDASKFPLLTEGLLIADTRKPTSGKFWGRIRFG
jgi:membrane dipeptidase